MSLAPPAAWRSILPWTGCGRLATGLLPLQGPTGGQGVPVGGRCAGAVRERLEAVGAGISQRLPGGQHAAVPGRMG